MLQDIKKEFVKLLLEKGALKIALDLNNLFEFKSGRKSTNFINIGALTDGESLSKLKTAYSVFIAELLLEKKVDYFDFIYGPAYKGISLACIACEGLHELYDFNVRYLYDRKEAKQYGDMKADQVIVGANYFKPGNKILLVDDVITTGGTKLEALEKIRILGEHQVVGLVIAVDRQERMGNAEQAEELSAVQWIEKNHGTRVFSIVSMKDVFEQVKNSLAPEIKEAWIAYYDKYGVVKLQ